MICELISIWNSFLEALGRANSTIASDERGMLAGQLVGTNACFFNDLQLAQSNQNLYISSD
jgi:hypothetical protein